MRNNFYEVYNKLISVGEQLKKRKMIQDFRVKLNKKENDIEVFISPIVSVEKIEFNFVIDDDGEII